MPLDKEQVRQLRRMKEKHPMPEQDPKERIKNFDEVPFGYDAETAVKEQRAVSSARKLNVWKGVLWK